MKKSILSTIAALLVIITSGIAQQELVVIEQVNGRYQRAKKPVRLNDNVGVFKFSPTQLLAGEINFSYEKQFSRYSSFEIGAGPTISNIAFGDNGGNHVIQGIGGGGYAYQTSRVGMFVEAAYRYYPLDDTEALNRFYLSPVLKFRVMNFGLEDASGLLSATQGSDMRMNFAMNIGYQWWLSKSFAIDLFGGMGIGYQEVTSSFPESVYVDNNWITQWIDNSRSGARYVFNFGVKVGIGHK